MTEIQTIGMSQIRLGELALDAALEIEDFLQRRGSRLDESKKLLVALGARRDFSESAPPRIDLAFLPVYESVLDMTDGPRPNDLADFERQVSDSLRSFLHEESADMLTKLRDLFITIHDWTLSERLDAINSAQNSSGQLVYAHG